VLPGIQALFGFLIAFSIGLIMTPATKLVTSKVPN
jgi:hypothetical protein